MSTGMGDRNGSALFDRLGDSNNVLLYAPAMTDAETRVCIDLLTPAAPASENFLSLSFSDPEIHFEHWESHASGLPADGYVIHVQGPDTGRVTDGGSPTGLANVMDVRRADFDLTGLGIALDEAFSALESGSNRTVFCFHSLTALLGRVSLERAFKFIHVLTRRVQTAGAVAHYHLDPSSADDQTRATLEQLFDAVVEVDSQGDIEVRTR